MTSPVIVEAIRTLVERRDLTRLEAAAAMEAIMSGAATSVQVAAFLTALRMKGETVEELIGFAEVMRLKAVRVRTRGRRRDGPRRHGPRDAHRHLRDRRRRVRHLQRVHGDRVRRGRRGAQGGQARQSVGLEPLRIRRRGGDPRGEPRPHPGPGRPVHRRGGHRLPLRSAPAHRDEARHARAPGDGDPHGLQHARAPDQPRRRQRPGDRRLQPGAHRAPGARPGRAGHASAPSWCTAPTGSTRSRRPARAGSPRCARAWCGRARSVPRTSGSPGRRSRDLRGGDREENARDHPPASWRGSRARAATSCW